LEIKAVVEGIGTVVGAAGVLVIVGGLLLSTARMMRAGRGTGDPYRIYREGLGRSILLGLEFMVAADIIQTVAVDRTLTNVFILGLIVLIRTFLSMALEVELEGRWPWQQAGDPARTAGG